MALFRKFFYKKPPDGLLEITERVYVFDYCFTTDVMDEDEYKVYLGGIIGQLREHFPDASFMVFNMREGDNQSQISNILCDYEMTVMDYPRQYEGCPLLTMEMIHHFLRSGENWLQLGPQNVVLMHCERGGWPVLAFMLAALLIYRKMYTGEQKTLDMIYKQAPRELLQLMSPLNPLPSQLRYLQYISRRNVGSEWPPLDRALTLDCIIIRHIPNMDGEGGCRPIFRIYGQDPFIPPDRTPKVLFSTPKRSKLVRHYKQGDCELVKIDIHCHVQGDVVLECISLDSDLEREQMMFRVMFNTAFIRSNILMLNRDEIDMLWNSKDQFPKDFRVEALFSDMDASSSVISIDLPNMEEKEGLPVEAFAKVKEIFSHVDWLDSKAEVANVLQQITVSNILLEKLDGGGSPSPSSILKESLSGRLKFDTKTQRDIPTFAVHGELSETPLRSSGDAPTDKKVKPLESKALLEDNIETPTSFGLSQDLDSTKKESESLEAKQSLENDPKVPTSMAQEKQSIPFIEATQQKIGSLESEEKNIESLESKTVLENDTMFSASVAQGEQSVLSTELSTNANSTKNIGPLGSQEKKIESLHSEAPSENDSKFKVEPKMQPEVDVRSPTSAGQEKISVSSFESSGDATVGKKKEPLDLKASQENNIKVLVPSDQGKQVFSSGLSEGSERQIKTLVSEASVGKDAKFPTSMAQVKNVSSSGLSADSEMQIKTLESKAWVEKDTKFRTSMAQEKHISSSGLSADSEVQIKTLESKALMENDTKFPAYMAQGKESIPLIEPSMHANSVKQKMGQLESKEKDNESFESKSLLENDTKYPPSMVQGKHSIALIEPSVHENSMKQTMGQLESKEKDNESLESKSLLENDTKCPPAMVPVKHSIPLIQTSVDPHSMEKKIGQPESMMSENDIKTPTSMVEKKQDSPLLEPSIDAKSIRKKIEPQDLQVSLQLPTQSKIISPQVHQGIRPPTVSSPTSSLQGSPVAMSRFNSAPSTLGITSVLQDHTPMDSKEVSNVEPISPASTLFPSASKMPKSIEPSSTSIPPASSATSHPSVPLKSSVDPPFASDKTFEPLRTPPPPQCEPTIAVTQHLENSMHDKSQKTLVPPPPPPLPSLSFEANQSSLSMAAAPTPAPITKSSSLSHPPSSPLPEASLSTVKDSLKGPPPPPPPLLPSSSGHTSSSAIPPPPPLSGLPSSPLSMDKSAAVSSPPPPPPPLLPSSSEQTSTYSIPPPPPLSGLPSSPLSMNKSAAVSSPPPPPPPLRNSVTTPSAPPPPPPPASSTPNSLAGSPAPPVPPPPSASANGLGKPGPPVPGPPGAPVFGAKGRGLLRANAKTQTKRSNLKPYHWLKLTRAMQGSLWAETQKLDEASRAPEFDMSELESLFSAAAPSSSEKGKPNRRASQKADKVQLIELRRAYNCEIMLTKVKIPLPDLMGAVLALDDSELHVDQVENLIKFCPTKEEIDLLKGYTGDKENLGKCEQFFLELMKVPRVENKLRVFSFKMQFCTQVKELRRDLNIVNSASEEIRNSVKLKRIMQTILSLGNALNHGTARGAAVGFRLDSLLKLTDTRARNNKMTLMHYLCKVLAEKLPELSDFPKDLVSLEASTKMQLKYLAEEMQAISKGLEKVIQELTASENDGPVSENFCQILKEFLSDAEAEVRSLAQLYANVGRNADALALYFGEDPAKCSFEQVVATLLNFVRMFIKAHDENCKQIEYDKKKAEKEAAENEKLKLAAKKDSENMIMTTIKNENIK